MSETPVDLSCPCYYFRLRVTNKGNCEARDVEIFAKDLKELVNGEFKSVARFSPMDLLWSDVRIPILPVLIPDLPKLCDLAHVVPPSKRRDVDHHLKGTNDKEIILALDLQITPNSYGHLVAPGNYRLTLALAAANAKPREYFLDFNVTGDWYDEPERMFADGIRFHLREI